MEQFLENNWGWFALIAIMILGGLHDTIDTWIERHYEYKKLKLKNEQEADNLED